MNLFIFKKVVFLLKVLMIAHCVLLADIFNGDETVLCGTSEVLISLFNKSVFALNDLVEIVLLDLNLFLSVLVMSLL